MIPCKVLLLLIVVIAVDCRSFNKTAIRFPGNYLSFDYLLGEDSFINTGADVVFVDYDIPKSIVDRYKAAGKFVVCYVNVGAWEEWRSDAAQFPLSVLGNAYDGWPGERWLDIRQQNVLLPIMRSRYQTALSKGCEGIDPDNMNGWLVSTGFPLTYANSLSYNRAVSLEAKNLGMLAGIKNSNEMATDLQNNVDFAVLESCKLYDECGFFELYPDADKPVFAIEYLDHWSESDFRRDACSYGDDHGLSFILKEYDLHGDYIVSCL